LEGSGDGGTVSREGKPIFYVCEGKSCRKSRKEHAAVLEALSGVAKVETVSCRDICDGPVVGFSRGKGKTWFEKVDGKKSREGLVALARGEEMARALKKRRVG
jgi:hypothetical protein